jgi:hypothetical protein
MLYNFLPPNTVFVQNDKSVEFLIIKNPGLEPEPDSLNNLAKDPDTGSTMWIRNMRVIAYIYKYHPQKVCMYCLSTGKLNIFILYVWGFYGSLCDSTL